MTQISPLEWDSQFFGFKIGRMDLLKDEGDLSRLRDEMAFGGYRLCYIFASSQVPFSGLKAAEAELVDRRVTFSRAVAPKARRMPPNGAPITASDMAALNELALQSAEFSRFRIDRNMPRDGWVRLYHKWIAGSVGGSLADEVLVERASGKVVGFLTVRAGHGSGSIGLFAVDASVRGQGVGTKLLARAEKWFQAQGCSDATVVTQGQNLAANRIYEKAGYSISDVTFVYHAWAPPLR